MSLSAGSKNEPLVYGAIALLLAGPFTADLLLPLGTAIWVVYLLPTVLAYLSSRPITPVAVSAIATLLTVIGFNLAPTGVDPEVAQVNRMLGVLTAWVLGGVGYLFVRNRLAIRKEEWLQLGQVRLANAVGGEQPVEQLGRNALNFLVDYLGAQAGAIFVRNGEGFRRQATYGVPADSPMPVLIRPEDGLLGQAASEGRTFILDTVPDDYLTFGSAFGQSAPRHLIIAPAVVEGDANTLIELGFNRANPEAAELLSRISEGLGISVRSAKYRAQLQELLEETQAQAEELQVQGEELRANNEELEVQSQALQESQARLEQQQAELEESNAQLEEQAQALEVQRDDLSRAQAALTQQTRELQQASRYKSEFLANMSHELRTPLNSLLIMARLLADDREATLTADQVKYAETIETSGNDLLALINDVLDISKIEAGKLELQPRRIRIPPMVEKLRDAFAAGATAKGLDLRVETLPGAPDDFESDPQRIEQVLRNFLSNAVKFTEAGEIVLSVGPSGDGRVAFTVRDTGVGIAPEQQQVIFEAFRQADGTISRKYGGTGLGLSISRELARLLGGEVRLESTKGKGSAFSLLLPETYDPEAVEPARPATMPVLAETRVAPAASPAPKRRNALEDDRERLTGDSRVLLVVEDDPAFARILYDLAHESGFECLIAETADEGALMARQYLPHAVILDMNLPDHTGLSVLDRIKRDARTRHIPVHVVSVDDNSQIALAAGAIGYMFKPVRREQLIDLLEGLEAHMAQRMRRVLVVEDDTQQAESIRLLLASREVETVDAYSAAQCLDRLGAETFDCMVLDLNLPDMPGLDLLEKLSMDESVGFPPVIVYTGRDLSQDEELRLRRYSKSIIVKGAKSPERLLDEVTLFLHQVVSDLPEPQQKLLSKALNRDAALDGRHILVVEDDIRNVYALTSIFEPHGAKVQIARNGREALTALEVAGNSGAPVELVLMDVMMPEMDGLAATRAIRDQPQWQDLPIIALTAKAMARDQQECLAAGANDYLAKPLDVNKLLSLVRVWMPR
ncbi:response regulator [Allosphingosinicella vermicomposti]|uniref:response regulator n=1 Tax=Allosphingosinicella vermicomposti TaxID=614671 RepID=UPI000D1087EB|nr:response regulator [Allosphingosinicella vermicomposti]